ncbi:hypothetical protein BKA66DRAFT_448541 [Pyrenochaeta sp. MPI-SDFR-AT-0127]|nr:hypothetical protein BKA66DRAFT_448541 [Pyrenochaeta sp. MPI-SDFR-AT-0127]
MLRADTALFSISFCYCCWLQGLSPAPPRFRDLHHNSVKVVHSYSTSSRRAKGTLRHRIAIPEKTCSGATALDVISFDCRPSTPRTKGGTLGSTTLSYPEAGCREDYPYINTFRECRITNLYKINGASQKRRLDSRNSQWSPLHRTLILTSKKRNSASQLRLAESPVLSHNFHSSFAKRKDVASTNMERHKTPARYLTNGSRGQLVVLVHRSLQYSK